MQERLIEKGFLKWLENLDVAPYAVIFFEIPKFIQHSYIQKWLREQSTPIIVTPTTDLVAWEVEILHADKGLFRISENSEGKWFNSHEEALEVGLQEALKLIEIVKS